MCVLPTTADTTPQPHHEHTAFDGPGSVAARLYQWACRRLYHEFAWSYDAVSAVVSAGRWDAWRRAVAPYVDGDVVLELGCGTGALLPHLAAPGRVVLGLDLSSAMLRQASTRNSEPADAFLVCAPAQQLPLPASSVDCVVATFPAPYIVDVATLAEVRRVLRLAGRLLITGLWVEPRDGLRHVPLVYGRPSPELLDLLAARFRVAGLSLGWRELDVANARLGLAEAMPTGAP